MLRLRGSVSAAVRALSFQGTLLFTKSYDDKIKEDENDSAHERDEKCTHNEGRST
jgi:hypothetical protein